MNDITIYQNFPTTDELKNLSMIASTAMKSGLYGGCQEKILMTLLSARELNIGPMMALNGGIWNIKGKVELSSRLMGALIRRGGHTINVIECNEKKCILKGKRKDNGDECIASFTIEDATIAGLANNSNWKNYTEDMLYARALSRLARRLYADIIGNCYVEGEIDKNRSIEPDPENLPVADSNVVNETNGEETPKDSDSDTYIKDILLKFPEEEREKLNEYLNKWMKSHSRSIYETVQRFSNIDELKEQFYKWLKK